METVLAIIEREMRLIGIDYHFMINKSAPVIYPYVTGEYNESEYSFEDASNSGEMLLEAWTRGSYLELIRLNDKIKQHFKDFRVFENGISLHIAYNGNYPRRTNDNTLKKLEIHLQIEYWEGE